MIINQFLTNESLKFLYFIIIKMEMEIDKERRQERVKLGSRFNQGIAELESLISKVDVKDVKDVKDDTIQVEPGYADQDCIDILQEYQSAPDTFDINHPKLRACLRPTPCVNKERPVRSHGRVYCTGRSDEDVIQPGQVSQTIELLSKRVDLQKVESRKDDQENSDDRLKFLRIKFELEANSAKKLEEQVEEEDSAIREMLATSPSVPVSKYIAERQRLEHKESEAVMTSKIIDLAKGNEMLTGMMAQLIQSQTKLTQEMSVMKVHLEKTHEAALRTLGEESFSTQIKNIFKGGVKSAIIKIVTSPLTAFNIVFFRPFKKAFNKWIRDPIELIWGTILLIAVILTLIVLAVKFNQSYPELMTIAMSGLNTLMEKFKDLNATFLGWLGPEVVEILKNGYTYAQDAAFNFFYWMTASLKGLFQSAVSYIIDSVKASMPSMSSFVPSMPSLKFWFRKNRKSVRKQKSPVKRKSVRKQKSPVKKKSVRRQKSPVKRKSVRKQKSPVKRKSVRKQKSPVKKKIAK
jgi:hypothetical protein